MAQLVDDAAKAHRQLGDRALHVAARGFDLAGPHRRQLSRERPVAGDEALQHRLLAAVLGAQPVADAQPGTGQHGGRQRR